jgi:hypothetical protein
VKVEEFASPKVIGSRGDHGPALIAGAKAPRQPKKLRLRDTVDARALASRRTRAEELLAYRIERLYDLQKGHYAGGPRNLPGDGRRRSFFGWFCR